MAGGGRAYGHLIDTLLASPEPSIRWKVRTHVLDEAPDSADIVALREEIRGSERVRRLLAPFSSACRPGAYAKWQGAHWVLAALADLGYSSGDPALHPLREQVLDTWLGAPFYTEFEATAKPARQTPLHAVRPRCCSAADSRTGGPSAS